MEAQKSDSISPKAELRSAEDILAHETHADLPPPALDLEPNMSKPSLEGRTDSHDTSIRDVHQHLLQPTHHTDSDVVSSTIKPVTEPYGQYSHRWTKRHIHRWRSPLLMVLFFVLGAAVSIAHCMFYPLLNGKVVGNSNQQEEKIR
jgi:hypothetical protein